MLAIVEKVNDEHAFDSAMEAVLWAGWAAQARAERGAAGSMEARRIREGSYRPYGCDDVFICINRAQQENKITPAMAKVVRYFAKVGAPPDRSFPDHVHALWEAGCDGIKEYLERKGIVYRD